MPVGKVRLRAKWPFRLALNSGFRMTIAADLPEKDASPWQGYPGPALWSPVSIYTPSTWVKRDNEK